jgi:septal ring factor EnvC (AmiA/AmiB activator)
MEGSLNEEQLPDAEMLTSQLQQADRQLKELKRRYYLVVCLIGLLAVWLLYLLIDRNQNVILLKQSAEELAIAQERISTVSSSVDDLQGELADLDSKSAEWKDSGPEVEKISGSIRRDITDVDERIEKLEDRINAVLDDESDE